MVFLVISARIALFRKMAQIPQISLNFTKFRGISRNLVNFTKFSHFRQNGSRNSKIGISEQLFKAEMVRFREHFRIFAKCQLFARKTLFRENPFLERNFQLFWSKTHFSGSGPPKNLPGAYVYKGFWAGPPKVRFWTKKSLLGTQNAKNGGIPPIVGKRGVPLEKAPCHLKNNQWTTRIITVSRERKMVIFQEFPTFYIKIRIFIENAEYSVRLAKLFAFVGPARPGCARSFIIPF